MTATAEEWKTKGNEAFASKDFQTAVDCFTKSIELAPTNHVLYSNRAGAYASLGQYELSLADAKRCIALKPDWPKGYSRKGLAEFRLGKVEEAISTYNAGLKIDPSNTALQEGLREATIAFDAGKLA